MTPEEIASLSVQVTSWDQHEVDQLEGAAAVKYAGDHERAVRRLYRAMQFSLPFSLRRRAIRQIIIDAASKTDAIRRRGKQIADRRQKLKL
ncbi:hypothetical protein [Sphingomonas dokdonensis]|uniref:Uncharacterized protein n=1 Tax=Sphingomonas dokdonensis TaxID=344880 RepID=A0A245ZHM2_9SPHN|nr:hypothetical protein [Sphingomonas dokdonensis]OWK29228.1 hypothetical protein SPDO_22090 [Sphingomonas dokdonensis]